MALLHDELMVVYRDLNKIFPEDLHIARPLIQMYQSDGNIDGARDLALTMARRMLAGGRPSSALGFLEMCRVLEHPEQEEVEALLRMAHITSSGPIDLDQGTQRTFALIDELADTEAREFLQQGHLVRFEQGEAVVRQGDVSQTFYLILEGQMSVQLDTGGGQSKRLSVLRPGHFFGEFACVYKLPRSATVSAIEPSVLLEFSNLTISQLMQRSPLAGERLMRTVQTRMVYSMTHSHPAFNDLPDADRRWLAEESKVREFNDGEEIPDTGAEASVGWIILYGEAIASREHGDSKMEFALGVGDMFGAANRYITLPIGTVVHAKGQCLACSVPEQVIQAFMNAYASFEQWIEPHGEERHNKLNLPLEEWDLRS
ncbi:MAG TPA: cyclic nucleotide-binding domain-containing protein [Mariprofundaceae bacterium]|nr:cyclic nucleotide-binding domain-containing protein [Mariprofundaceae bacterium]